MELPSRYPVYRGLESIEKPFYFPIPVVVKSSVICAITNNSTRTDYPNNVINPLYRIPYECMFIGKWE